MVEVVEPLHHKRLEQLQRHRLGQAALVQLELRADHDDRTARVVDALAEQVLPEPALLALQHVGDRLERAVAGAGDWTAAAAVVEERVHCLLKHPLLVVDNDFGRTEIKEPLQPAVAVDHPPVQVVQIRCREPATVELHHRAQVRRETEIQSSTIPVGLFLVVRNAETTLSRLSARVSANSLPTPGWSRAGPRPLPRGQRSPAASEWHQRPWSLRSTCRTGSSHLPVQHLITLEVCTLRFLKRFQTAP